MDMKEIKYIFIYLGVVWEIKERMGKCLFGKNSFKNIYWGNKT